MRISNLKTTSLLLVRLRGCATDKRHGVEAFLAQMVGSDRHAKRPLLSLEVMGSMAPGYH
jgi:hypothetical protein